MSLVFSRITSKAQTTVPKDVRQALDVGPGDTLSYEVTINNLSATVDVATAAFAFSAVPMLDNAAWTCIAETGATCPAAGTGMPAHAVSLDAGTGVLYSISGGHDLIALAATATVGDMDVLTDAIGAIDGVERTHSSIILSTKFER